MNKYDDTRRNDALTRCRRMRDESLASGDHAGATIVENLITNLEAGTAATCPTCDAYLGLGPHSENCQWWKSKRATAPPIFYDLCPPIESDDVGMMDIPRIGRDT